MTTIGPLVATERRRRRHARKRGKQRTNAIKGQVLNLTDGAGLAGKHQIAHRDRARVKTNYEWIHGAIGHEGVGAVHVGDGLGEGLAHVGAGMERELQQSIALDRLVLDTLNAVDVKKMIFVIEDQVAFHLRRAHSAVRLSNVDYREVQIREDVRAHAEDGQHRAKRYGEDQHQHGNRPPQGGSDEPHDG